jgi:hypothetical protein
VYGDREICHDLRVQTQLRLWIFVIFAIHRESSKVIVVSQFPTDNTIYFKFIRSIY